MLSKWEISKLYIPNLEAPNFWNFNSKNIYILNIEGFIFLKDQILNSSIFEKNQNLKYLKLEQLQFQLLAVLLIFENFNGFISNF